MDICSAMQDLSCEVDSDNDGNRTVKKVYTYRMLKNTFITHVLGEFLKGAVPCECGGVVLFAIGVGGVEDGGAEGRAVGVFLGCGSVLTGKEGGERGVGHV